MDNFNCFYVFYFEMSLVCLGEFIGLIIEGGFVNFFNVKMNLYGNGIYIECVGYIVKE